MGSTVKVNGAFISEKVSKVRWVPEQYKAPTTFISGSWFFNENSLKLWNLGNNEFTNEDNEYVPKCSAKLAFSGDVTDMQFVNFQNIAVGSSNGTKITFILLKPISIVIPFTFFII